MKARGFSLIELMITIAIAGIAAVAVYSMLGSGEEQKQEAYQLLKKTDRLLSVSTEYYRSSCRVPDFQLTLNKLKQKQLISNSFTYPDHEMRLTAAQTAAAYLHLEITLNNNLATHFVAINPKAQAVDANTVVISVPVSAQLLPERERLIAMKTLWGENLC